MMPRLCASCKKMLLDAIREGASDLHCYKGRVRIYQVLPIFEEIQRIILKHGTVIDIADQAAREGVRTLRQSGLVKVKQGMTSVEEVLGCTNE